MDAKTLADSVLQLIPRVSVPATPENIRGLSALYEVLGQMQRGELILIPSASQAQPMDLKVEG